MYSASSVPPAHWSLPCFSITRSPAPWRWRVFLCIALGLASTPFNLETWRYCVRSSAAYPHYTFLLRNAAFLARSSLFLLLAHLQLRYLARPGATFWLCPRCSCC